MLVDLIGYAAGALLAVCFLPQVLQTWRARSAEGVSRWMVLLTFLSAILYEVYAALQSLWPVVVMNGVFCGMVGLQLLLVVLYSNRRRQSQTTRAD